MKKFLAVLLTMSVVTDAHRKEVGPDLMVSFDMLEERESWCNQENVHRS